MPNLTIDYQPATETCHHCGKQYEVSRGSVYDEEIPFALYLAGMHGCQGQGSVVLAIAVKGTGEDPPCSVSLQIWPTEAEYQMIIIEPDISPWRTHSYLGRMLTRNEALSNPQIETFFNVADQVVMDNPDVSAFLSK